VQNHAIFHGSGGPEDRCFKTYGDVFGLRLNLAAAERAETQKANAEQRERGGFGNSGYIGELNMNRNVQPSNEVRRNCPSQRIILADCGCVGDIYV
jgi:hypothetical protein